MEFFLPRFITISYVSMWQSHFFVHNLSVLLIIIIVNGFWKLFARESKKLYGGHFITFNVHCLIHLPDDVMRFGPLDKFSSFLFENYLQQLKRRIRRSSNPLAQLVKRLSESSKTQNYCGLITTPNSVILKQEHKNGPTIPFENTRERQFKVAQCDHWRLSCLPPNNCVYLNNETVFLIHKLCNALGLFI
jgi:hypothetical protein